MRLSKLLTLVLFPSALAAQPLGGGIFGPSGGSGSGTVTSVGFEAPAIFSVSGSPVTTSGTISLSLASQAANLVWAGPTSGGAASPSFRSLVAADIPAANNGLSLISNGYVNFGGTSGAGGFGVRDNAGDIECKNSGGAWTPCARTANELIGSSGATIPSGASSACVLVWYASTIEAVQIGAESAGNATIDVRTVARASWNGSGSAVSITGGDPLVLSAGTQALKTSLGSWTTSVPAETYVCFFASAVTAGYPLLPAVKLRVSQ